jgi:hypothetical protein
MSKLSHNDNPTAEDGFNQQNFVKCIAEIIRKCEPPKGIAINGYWGCGKTSALLQIHKELTGKLPHEYKPDQKAEIVPIWFEAWRYQNDSQPVLALLHKIRSQISTLGKVTNSAQKLTRIAFDSVFDMVGKAANMPALDKINGAAQRYETQNRETPLASQELRELLETAISQVLGKSKDKDKRLVIFIDDLDRCMPKTALQLLEGIKVYLNLKNCVLVFAMDQRQIEDALKEAKINYPHEYLEKICQDIHPLPLPTQAAKSEYLLDLLDQLSVTTEDTEQLNKILAIYDCLPANPRKIKALSNRIAMLLRNIKCQDELTLALDIKRSYSILLAMACIHTFHRLINEQLEKNPRYISDVINYSNKPEPEEEKYKPMLNLIPIMIEGKEMPTNPSDSNVFRLQTLICGLGTIAENEIKPFLTSTQ